MAADGPGKESHEEPGNLEELEEPVGNNEAESAGE